LNLYPVIFKSLRSEETPNPDLTLQVQGRPPHWGSYVTVDDVDATARTARDLGGKVLLGPHDIPNVGRFCVIEDPQGAVISAIAYKNA